MTKNQNEQTSSIESSLEVIDIHNYQTPEKGFDLNINAGLIDFIQDIFSSDDKVEEYQPFDKLNSFNRDQIDKIAPKPEWIRAQENLDEYMNNLPADENSKIVFIDKPNSGTKSIIQKYINHQDYIILDDPDYDDIINYQSNEDINIEQSQNIAILGLENWFLRYFAGIEYIENVMKALSHHEHNVVIVCNSWTWQFITTVLKIPVTEFDIKIFQALNHKDLHHWLLNLSNNSENRKLLYRMANSGKLVSESQIPIVEELDEIMAEKGKTLNDIIYQIDEKYMKKLAAYSLGLPLTSWHIWRHSLRRHLDENTIELVKDNELSPYTIWVLPWDEISFPELSRSMTNDEKIILHTLLLHRGLPLDMLARLLDIENYHLKDHIARLEKAGIIYCSNNNYYVSSNVYPKIRKVLRGTGFLVDDLGVN